MILDFLRREQIGKTSKAPCCAFCDNSCGRPLRDCVKARSSDDDLERKLQLLSQQKWAASAMLNRPSTSEDVKTVLKDVVSALAARAEKLLICSKALESVEK